MLTFRTWVWLTVSVIGLGFISWMVDGAIGDTEAVNQLTQAQAFVSKDLPVLPLSMPWPNMEFFGALLNLMTLEFSIFSGAMIWVRFILLAMLSGVIYGLIVNVGPILLSAFSTAIYVFRSLAAGVGNIFFP